VTLSEEFRLLPEGSEETRPSARGAERASGGATQLGGVVGAEVWHAVLLCMAPQVLDGVELGSVGGKKLELETILVQINEIPHSVAAMNSQSVPDDQEPARKETEQASKEIDDLRRFDAAWVDPEADRVERQTDRRSSRASTS